MPAAKSTVFPSDWSRKRPAMAAREVAQKGARWPLFRSQVRTRVEGLDILERTEGPVIFVANHASHLDTPLILLSLPDEWRRRTAVAAAADYFFDTWWRAVGSSLLLQHVPARPPRRRHGRDPGRGAGRRLEPGDLPRGHPLDDGWMGKFRMGAAFLAKEYGVPVVPVAHRRTYAAMPRGQGWPSRGRRQLTIRFGEPLVPGRTSRCASSRPGSRTPVAALLDEDRSTWWEARQRSPPAPYPTRRGRTVAQWRRVWEQTESPVADAPTRRLAAWRR